MPLKLNMAVRFNREQRLCFPLFFPLFTFFFVFFFKRLVLCPSLPALCLLHSKEPLNVTYGKAKKQIHTETHTV